MVDIWFIIPNRKWCCCKCPQNTWLFITTYPLPYLPRGAYHNGTMCHCPPMVAVQPATTQSTRQPQWSPLALSFYKQELCFRLAWFLIPTLASNTVFKVCGFGQSVTACFHRRWLLSPYEMTLQMMRTSALNSQGGYYDKTGSSVVSVWHRVQKTARLTQCSYS